MPTLSIQRKFIHQCLLIYDAVFTDENLNNFKIKIKAGTGLSEQSVTDNKLPTSKHFNDAFGCRNASVFHQQI
jgi:hypothetical protein